MVPGGRELPTRRVPVTYQVTALWSLIGEPEVRGRLQGAYRLHKLRAPGGWKKTDQLPGSGYRQLCTELLL